MKITTAKGILEGESIEAILEKHGRDCLRGANLHEVDLSNADLRGASLRNANLRNAYLRGAKLSGACLYNANLSNAYLCYSNLRGADLTFANLYHANLRGADMCGVCLFGADLRGANLCYSNLRGANLRGANLCNANGADLIEAQSRIIPDEGDIIGWKKAQTRDENPVIVKLLIPADAQRSNTMWRKCRANKARVLDLQDPDGNSLKPDTVAYSVHDPEFTYRLGDTVESNGFDPDRWTVCVPGIHFFITRAEAAAY
nr:MAG TPA: pentapeptide repeat protein [Caudoviricetes sp.]